MTLGYKILAVLLLVAALVGALYAGVKIHDHHIYQQGWNARDDKAKKDEQAIKDDMQKKHDVDVAKAKADTDALHLKFETVMTEKVAVEKKYADLQERHQAAARAGTERLLCPATRHPVSPGTEGGDPAAASGTGTETRADLMPEDAAEILGFAADAARLVRDYGRVVDLYNDARETCNAVRH